MKQIVIPAISTYKRFEKFLASDFELGVFLEVHISQLKNITRLAERYRKKLIFHVDLIEGLKNDERGTEFLCQEYKPYGLISTKASVIQKAKQKGVLSIQRVFLLDSQALEQSYKLIEFSKPDYIEVLPGVMPWMIEEIKEQTKTPILAGGLIRKSREVKQAISAGATAVTTSNTKLWDIFEKEKNLFKTG
ncbi:glycerol-3-phosphate responsive antiterminator [Fervidibacillus halotolerans]|uniref:Glycerol uptake operon antiterminator regulatory protein n=1 Tax=Fervidibacillus halotolerans TaxID=2980027 RepID=A0A9E8RZ11_9BACI|nr:glycerol-3-phosphate responsive antiterminator [Fervidibacillus halotolerans]WAA13411.1 glycerol-3-phosphate responsive antiterminator [Fervidibacillus halotolerans]